MSWEARVPVVVSVPDLKSQLPLASISPLILPLLENAILSVPEPYIPVLAESATLAEKEIEGADSLPFQNCVWRLEFFTRNEGLPALL